MNKNKKVNIKITISDVSKKDYNEMVVLLKNVMGALPGKSSESNLCATDGYAALLERPDMPVKIKGDAGEYEIWAVDWLNMKIMIYRAGEYQWIDFDKLKKKTHNSN